MIPSGCVPERTFVIIDISWWMSQIYYVGGLESLLATTIGRLANLLRGDVPWFLAVAADSVGPTWRHELTEGMQKDWQYKGNREARPAEYQHVCNRIFEVIRLHRIPILYCEGYEADDCIAAAVDRARAFDLTTAILTADKDLGALCDEKTFLWDGKESLRGPAEIESSDKHPVPPRLMADLLAIASDRGDNIPGVPSLGPAKAAAILRAYGSLQSALEATPEHVPDATIKAAEKLRAQYKKSGDVDRLAAAITNLEILREKRDLAKWLEKLHENKIAAELSLQLTTLDRSCPITFDINELAIGGYDADKLRKTYRGLGFSNLANEVTTFPKTLPDWMLPESDPIEFVPSANDGWSFDQAPTF